MTNALTELFARAAAVLSGAARLSESGDDVRGLIGALDYGDDAAAAPQQAALLAAAAKLKRVFELRAPDAPGLVFCGGEADPAIIGWTDTGDALASLSGTGLTRRQAFESCVGEGVEYLSQFDLWHDALEHGTVARRTVMLDGKSRSFLAALAEHVQVRPEQELAFVAARRLSDGASVHLPADMCLRRARAVRNFVPPFKLGTGCAAGVSFAGAALHGLLELVERDAVSLWWRGGYRGRAIALEGPAGREAADLIGRLRMGEAGRVSWLLDITTDVGVPCVAALSCRPDGFGFACGHAARASMAAAARAAICEMCQMELGQALVEAKRRERGEGALNEGDLRHVQRATQIDARQCALLHPVGIPSSARALDGEEREPALLLRTIVDRLARMEIETFAFDLSRAQFAIPVVRIVAPGLQLEPSAIATERLTGAIAATGGGQAHSGDVTLL